MPEPIAVWNPARGAWETRKSQAGMFCEHSELYLETFPTSGSMRNGKLFPRQTSEPPTGGNEFSSSLLPTPQATDFKGSAVTQNGRLRSGRKRLEGDMDLPEAVSLLPTPRGTFGGEDPENYLERRDRPHPTRNGKAASGMPLDVAVSLLPTPNSRDWKGSPGQGSRERGGHQSSLPAAIGDATNPRSEGGNSSPGDPRQSQLLLQDGAEPSA